MKAKKPKRRHGKSRLERLLEDSIRYELAIKALRRELFSLSLAVARLERNHAVDSERTNGVPKRGISTPLDYQGLVTMGLPAISGMHGSGIDFR